MGLKKVRRREMFLNKTMFKKWIKDAFNHGGLTVGYIFDMNWSAYRILQSKKTGSLIALSESLYRIIDLKELEDESAPMGPSARNEQGDLLIWKNQNSALAVCSSKLGDDGNRVLEALESIDFRKEDK